MLEEKWSAIEAIELEIIIEQIRSLKVRIRKLDQAINEEAGKLKGFDNLKTVAGSGSLSAGILLAVIGEIRDFASVDKLASYTELREKDENI